MGKGRERGSRAIKQDGGGDSMMVEDKQQLGDTGVVWEEHKSSGPFGGTIIEGIASVSLSRERTCWYNSREPMCAG